MKTRHKLRGLSWGHRRASGALGRLTEAFTAQYPNVDLIWEDRTLAGFEHHDLGDVAAQYDLIIYDHPFSGDVAQKALFLPLSDALGDLARASRFVANNLELYLYKGVQWGLPIDAASQHALVRHDLLRTLGEAVPRSWADVLALGKRLRAEGLYLGSAFIKPHGGLIIAALMANQGAPWWNVAQQRVQIDQTVLRRALLQLAELAALCPPQALQWDAIDLHEVMVARDDIVYAPCAYGYATYGEADQRRRLGFAPFAGPIAPYEAGTAIGGTGIAVSAQAREPDAALDFIRFMASDLAQNEIIPANHGQPALAIAWNNPHWDTVYNGYFSAIRSSLEMANVRPRIPGYIHFQDRLGGLVSGWLEERLTEDAVCAAIAEAAAVTVETASA
ncbi:ABC transporter substrate-binding protein [Asticcacaulis sp. 201]|uniref:ABC transporter substrate-binding protein n=1 Tax=Asticcacaulis sp. 201 TaxID=3028787 RepID=UPI0029163175|nr:extracellular solute-binding protein [Asticcacaulis sp. 201]MDV6330674.1 extracellular solute-binding protein [Asticcacaulis sp. 201]